MPAFAQMLGRVARGLENDGDDPPFVWLVSVNISSLSFILSRIGRCEPGCRDGGIWGAAGWRVGHGLVLQLVAAKFVDVVMEESGERPGGMVPLRIPPHLAWADAPAPPPRAGAGARRSTRTQQRQHEAEGAWARI